MFSIGNVRQLQPNFISLSYRKSIKWEAAQCYESLQKTQSSNFIAMFWIGEHVGALQNYPYLSSPGVSLEPKCRTVNCNVYDKGPSLSLARSYTLQCLECNASPMYFSRKSQRNLRRCLGSFRIYALENGVNPFMSNKVAIDDIEDVVLPQFNDH